MKNSNGVKQLYIFDLISYLFHWMKVPPKNFNDIWTGTFLIQTTIFEHKASELS